MLRASAAGIALLAAPPCLGDNAAFDRPQADVATGSTTLSLGSEDATGASSSGLGQSTLRVMDGTSDGGACLDSGFSYFDPAKLEALGTADIVVGARSTASDWVADTRSGRIVELTDGEPIEIRPAGEGVLAGVGFHVYVANGAAGVMGVFSFTNMTIDFGSTLSGVGDHPLGIFATGDVTIRGMLSVASAMEGPVGAGGRLGGVQGGDGNGPGAGLAGTDGGSRNRPGGGGGAFGSPGGNGGAGPITAGGWGGSPFGNDALEPLTGGSGGAAAHGHSAGGAGGGACTWRLATRSW